MARSVTRTEELTPPILLCTPALLLQARPGTPSHLHSASSGDRTAETDALHSRRSSVTRRPPGKDCKVLTLFCIGKAWEASLPVTV